MVEVCEALLNEPVESLEMGDTRVLEACRVALEQVLSGRPVATALRQQVADL
jgi:hypothetical protein